MRDRKPKVPIPAPVELHNEHPCVLCGEPRAKRSGMRCQACVAELVERAKLNAVPTVIDSTTTIEQIRERKAEVGYANRGKAYRRGAVDHDQAKATAQRKAARRRKKQKARRRIGTSTG